MSVECAPSPLSGCVALKRFNCVLVTLNDCSSKSSMFCCFSLHDSVSVDLTARLLVCLHGWLCGVRRVCLPGACDRHKQTDEAASKPTIDKQRRGAVVDNTLMRGYKREREREHARVCLKKDMSNHLKQIIKQINQ